MKQHTLPDQLSDLAHSLKSSVSAEFLLEALSLLGLVAKFDPKGFTELYNSGGNRQLSLLKTSLAELADQHPDWPCNDSDLSHLTIKEWQPLIYFIEENRNQLEQIPQALRDLHREMAGKFSEGASNEATSELLVAMANTIKPRSLYDGTAGMADIPSKVKPDQMWLEEKMGSIWGISYRLLLIEGIAPTFRHGDSLTNTEFKHCADLVIMQPPFGYRLSPKETDLLLKQGNIIVDPGTRLPSSAGDALWIQQALAHANDHGKVLLLLPQGWLFRGGYDAKIREYLLNEDIIEAIIGLPQGMVSSSSIPSVLLVLNKQKQPGTPIHFVDGSDMGQRERRKQTLSSKEIEHIVHLANGSRPDDDHYRAVYLPDIRKNGKKGIGGNSLNIREYFVHREAIELPHPDDELARLHQLQSEFETAQQKLIALLNN